MHEAVNGPADGLEHHLGRHQGCRVQAVTVTPVFKLNLLAAMLAELYAGSDSAVVLPGAQLRAA